MQSLTKKAVDIIVKSELAQIFPDCLKYEVGDPQSTKQRYLPCGQTIRYSIRKNKLVFRKIGLAPHVRAYEVLQAIDSRDFYAQKAKLINAVECLRSAEEEGNAYAIANLTGEIIRLYKRCKKLINTLPTFSRTTACRTISDTVKIPNTNF